MLELKTSWSRTLIGKKRRTKISTCAKGKKKKKKAFQEQNH